MHQPSKPCGSHVFLLVVESCTITFVPSRAVFYCSQRCHVEFRKLRLLGSCVRVARGLGLWLLTGVNGTMSAKRN